jgi:tetratricopeptide (TPR) repeat protein
MAALLAATVLTGAVAVPAVAEANGANPAPAPASVRAPEPASAVGGYLAGRYAQHRDDWHAASLYMAAALAADPADEALLRRTFVLKLGEGQVDAAIVLAGRLAARDAETQLATALLAAAELAAGHPDEAGKRLTALPRDGMGRYIAPLLSAWQRMAAGKPDEALAALAPLGAASGFSPLMELHSGLLLDLAGRADEAAGHYARVAGEDAPLRVVQVVGSFHERHGRRDEARRLYETFHRANPDSMMVEPLIRALDAGGTAAPVVADPVQGAAEAMFDIASALHHEGVEESALLFSRIALYLNPRLGLARLMLGDILAARDHQDRAIDEFTPLQGDPMLGWLARLRNADALAHEDRIGDAIVMLEELAAERPERSDALVRLGDLYRQDKRFAEAAKAYTLAIDRLDGLEERHWPLLYARAISYDRSDDWARAEADLVQALEVSPDQPALLNYLGYTWVDRGINLPRARSMIERAVELKPKDGYIVDSLGWALYRLGDFDGAVARLERAVELRPQDATINDHLGDAYWRVGRGVEARFQWERALATADEDPLKEQIRVKLEHGLPDRKAAEARTTVIPRTTVIH